MKVDKAETPIFKNTSKKETTDKEKLIKLLQKSSKKKIPEKSDLKRKLSGLIVNKKKPEREKGETSKTEKVSLKAKKPCIMTSLVADYSSSSNDEL